MNANEVAVLQACSKGTSSLRAIASLTGFSLGSVSNYAQSLRSEGYLLADNSLSETAKLRFRVRSAIILAAGAGLRSLPLDRSKPKAFLKVKGQTLIERHILQLKEKGIDNIYIVIGYQKAMFEPLIDRYGVKLIVNNRYAADENSQSLAAASQCLKHSYVIPCDLYFEGNPYSKYEFGTWYMVTESGQGGDIALGTKSRLSISGKKNAKMVGLAHIDAEDCECLVHNLSTLEQDHPHFWEDALFGNNNICVMARLIGGRGFIDINSYEDLRRADPDSPDLENKHIQAIMASFGVMAKDIRDVSVMKKGMTNRSFCFSYQGDRFIMRIPGEGTDMLIDRVHEYEVYQTIQGLGISDEVRWMNPTTGVKITRFIPNARNCDPTDPKDVEAAMKFLKHFHEQKLSVPFRFDLFGQIDFYESLWRGKSSNYYDYQKTKSEVLSLKRFIDSLKTSEYLTHIDAVPDNFLFCDEGIRLIDWEYAANQDQHVDLAMFAIYVGYDRKQIDFLIDCYFEGHCDELTRIKIYAYISVCGLLWSNWCEYKEMLGVEFGDYSIKQYRYAKEYSSLTKKELAKRGL